eukprot:scaffold211177_cov41-Prasinocladus_malaysianus.AAC.1
MVDESTRRGNHDLHPLPQIRPLVAHGRATDNNACADNVARCPAERADLMGHIIYMVEGHSHSLAFNDSWIQKRQG